MGFLKDLFGPRKPCDLCQLGQAEWPPNRSAAIDWKLTGGGLNAKLFICQHCSRFLRKADLTGRSPLVGLFALVANAQARRPPVHAYLQHPEWRKVWLHMIDTGPVAVEDEFQALTLMRAVEEEFYEKVANSVAESRQQQERAEQIYRAHSPPPPPPPRAETARAESPPLPVIVRSLQPFRWGMTKKEVQQLMEGHFALPPSTTEDALGWIIELYAVPTAVVAYFRPTMRGGRLARVGIAPFAEDRPDDATLEGLYSLMKRDLIAYYGEPGRTSRGDRSVPVEFRQSEIVSWVDGGSCIVMSMGLQRDGVPAEGPALGLNYGDLQWDPISQMQARLHR